MLAGAQKIRKLEKPQAKFIDLTYRLEGDATAFSWRSRNHRLTSLRSHHRDLALASDGPSKLRTCVRLSLSAPEVSGDSRSPSTECVPEDKSLPLLGLVKLHSLYNTR